MSYPNYNYPPSPGYSAGYYDPNVAAQHQYWQQQHDAAAAYHYQQQQQQHYYQQQSADSPSPHYAYAAAPAEIPRQEYDPNDP
jgi:hypothetical protein